MGIGRHGPRIVNLRALCVLFEVSADFLLFGEEKFAAKDEQRTQEMQAKEQELELLLQQEHSRREEDREDLRYRLALYLCGSIFMCALTLISLLLTAFATSELISMIRDPEKMDIAVLSPLFIAPRTAGNFPFFLHYAGYVYHSHRRRLASHAKKIKNVTFC